MSGDSVLIDRLLRLLIIIECLVGVLRLRHQSIVFLTNKQQIENLARLLPTQVRLPPIRHLLVGMLCFHKTGQLLVVMQRIEEAMAEVLEQARQIKEVR